MLFFMVLTPINVLQRETTAKESIAFDNKRKGKAKMQTKLAYKVTHFTLKISLEARENSSEARENSSNTKLVKIVPSHQIVPFKILKQV